MDDQTLRSLLGDKVQQSINFSADQFTRFRIQAERMYEGLKDGTEIPGRSQVVSRDVAEAIDSMMPGLMRIFYQSGKVVRFLPRKIEDVAQMEQVSDYIDYLWNTRNPGYETMHDWFKAALMFRLGVIKVLWDKSIDVTEECYENLTEQELAVIAENPDYEILEEKAYADPDALTLIENGFKLVTAQALVSGQQPPEPPQIDEDSLPKRYDIKVKLSKERGRIKVHTVPSEEFLFDHWTTSQDTKGFFAHRRQMTKSELREMKFDDDLIDQIEFSPGTENVLQEKFERFRPEETGWNPSNSSSGDESQDSVWVSECYLLIDWDGDGIAEYRCITIAGDSDYTILDNCICDSHPFVVVTPIRSPFKMVGQSITDQVIDLQRIKTQLTRQALDNTYLANQTRYVMNDNVNMDDVMNPRPGSPIRVEGSPSDSIMPLPVQPISDSILGMITYVDGVRDRRTGLSPYNQGLDADELNDTATGVALIQQAGAARQELIARNFAEGLARAFRRIYALLSQHQVESDAFRVGSNWIPIQPTTWATEYDVEVLVGLGTGNRDRELAGANAIIQLQQTLVQQQGLLNGGPAGALSGPFVTAQNVYAALSRLVEGFGLKVTDGYFSNPATMPPPKPQGPPPPDPQAQMIAAQTQIEQAKLQEKAREFNTKTQLQVQKNQADLALEHQKLQTDAMMKAAQLKVSSQHMAVNTLAGMAG
jgi:hypothetical protein